MFTKFIKSRLNINNFNEYTYDPGDDIFTRSWFSFHSWISINHIPGFLPEISRITPSIE